MTALPEKYKILSEIARDQYRLVLKCLDTLANNVVAVKVWLTVGEGTGQSVHRQYNFLAKIEHPHLIKALGAGISPDGFPYLVTEWSKKGDILSNISSLTMTEKTRLMIQTAEAVDFLHSIGYIHGDIKPSNVLLFTSDSGELQIKLTDFEFSEPGGYISPKMWKGTPAYMAPEIIRGEPVDSASDLYALGVLSFQLLTGRLPFEEQELYSLAYAQLDKEPSFVATEIITTPPNLVSSTLRLLAKNPIERIEAAWKVRNNLLEDDKPIREADRRLGYCLADYLWKAHPHAEPHRDSLSKSLTQFFPGIGVDCQLDRYLLNKSGGNPEIANHYLHGLVEEDFLGRRDGIWTLKRNFNCFLLPKEAIAQYLPIDVKRLDLEGQMLLKAASVFELPVDLELLKEIVNLESQNFEKWINNLLDSDWLIKSGFRTACTVNLVKGVYQDFMLQDLDKETLYGLRHQVVNILQQKTRGPEQPDILKELLYQAWQLKESPLIHSYSLQLSDWAQSQNLKDETLEYSLMALQHAGDNIEERTNLLLRLATLYDDRGLPKVASDYYLQFLSCPPRDQDIVAEAERKLGWCFARLSNFKEATGYLNSSIQGFIILQNEMGHIRGLMDLAAAKRMEKKFPECEAVLKECGELLRGCEFCQETAHLYKLKGVLNWHLGDYQEAYDNYLQSIQLFERLGIDREVAATANNLGLLLRDWNKPNEALKYLEIDLRITEKAGDKIGLSFTYNNVSLVYLSLGRIDEAVECAKLALEMSLVTSYRDGIALAHNNLGYIYLSKGLLDKALFHLRQASPIFEEISNPSGKAFAFHNLAELYRIRELPELSKEYYTQSLRIRRELGEKLGIADCLCGLSRLCLENLNVSTSQEYFEEAISLYNQLNKNEEIAQLTLIKSEALLLAGRLAEAKDALAEAVKKIDDGGRLELISLRQMVQGLMGQMLGEYELAEAKFQNALKGFISKQDRVLQAKTALYIGDLYKYEGRLRQANRFWRESLALYRDLRVQPKISKLEVLMRELEGSEAQNIEHVKTLSQVSQLLAQINDEEEFLRQSLRASLQLLGAERGAIIIYDEKADSYEVKVSHQLEAETRKDVLEISRQTVKEVQKTGIALISEDSLADPVLQQHRSIRIHNILSIICAPLTIHQKVVGTLYLDSRSLKRAFTQADREFVEAFSNLMAVGISKVQSYSRIYQELCNLRQKTGKVYEYPNIIGRSPLMQDAFSMVNKAAPTKASVLIMGESGTGKELIANLIHNLSDRKVRPFVRVNCAAIPDTLLESELFGIEEKIATGVTFREGKFKQADGGTIFLDEVGDMSLATQAKVLRVLQEEEFERVGGQRVLKVNIRVITATNKDLDKLIKENLFRHDLYYRLNTITITVPPLRERREDIPSLIEHFLQKFSHENSKGKVIISPDVIQRIYDYDWPGNVRQLMNVIQRGVIFSESGEFDVKYLPPELSERMKSARLISIGKLRNHLAREEKYIISLALRQTNWNQAKAAEILDLPPSSLARKISKYRIKRPTKL